MYRTDGYRVRTKDAMYEIVPYIMPKRFDASNSIKVDADLEKMQDYIRKCRAKGIKMSHMAILIAAYLRLTSQNPLVNRFAMNKKIYARNHFCVSFVTLKPDQDTDTVTKVYFNLDDDIFTVNRKIEEAIEKVQVLDENNAMDNFMPKLLAVPFLMRVAVGGLKLLDKYFTMPFTMVDISPFHTSLFVTNLASIRTDTVNHHLYEFGTTSVFMAIGKKEILNELQRDGSVKTKHVINMRFVLDERICDGYYFASAIKLFKHFVKNPELLLSPPDYISEDY